MKLKQLQNKEVGDRSLDGARKNGQFQQRSAKLLGRPSRPQSRDFLASRHWKVSDNRIGAGKSTARACHTIDNQGNSSRSHLAFSRRLEIGAALHFLGKHPSLRCSHRRLVSSRRSYRFRNFDFCIGSDLGTIQRLSRVSCRVQLERLGFY